MNFEERYASRLYSVFHLYMKNRKQYHRYPRISAPLSVGPQVDVTLSQAGVLGPVWKPP